MKYIVVLGDGMSGEPLDELGSMTTLEYAQTPMMDELALHGQIGMTQNVPLGMHPGSEVANLSVLGYDPLTDFTGRSPLEALSVGVAMEPGDIIFRANLVTLSEKEESYGDKKIIDHSSGEISTQDADVLMDAIREAFDNDEFRFYTGTSYRHICVWKNGKSSELEPPHDHLTKVIGPYLPAEEKLRAMMEKSFDILNDHPLNAQRVARGENKGNSLWFWGAGTEPHLGRFYERTGLRGAMISAVDLLKGIAVGAGMKIYEVQGATGSLHTNYEGKANAAIQALLEDGNDFVYVHLEGPDEMAHQGLVMEKVQSIEYLDSRIIAPIVNAMEAAGEDYRILVLPDHPNPVRYRTHTADPVPYLLYDSTCRIESGLRYSERAAKDSGIYESQGHQLLGRFLK